MCNLLRNSLFGRRNYRCRPFISPKCKGLWEIKEWCWQTKSVIVSHCCGIFHKASAVLVVYLVLTVHGNCGGKLKGRKTESFWSENEECIYSKQNFILYVEFGKHKTNSHLLRKTEGNIDKDKILYFMLFFQSSFFDPKLSQVKPEMWMPQIEKFFL